MIRKDINNLKDDVSLILQKIFRLEDEIKELKKLVIKPLWEDKEYECNGECWLEDSVLIFRTKDIEEVK